MKRQKLICSLLPLLLFVLFSLHLLLGLRGEYLEEVGGMTPFYLNTTFTTHLLGRGPEGWLAWCSSALGACMTVPILGASLFTALLCLLALLLKQGLRIGWPWTALCYLPSLWLLADFCSGGYELYTSKQTDSTFSLLFALLFAALLWVIVGRWVWNKGNKKSVIKHPMGWFALCMTVMVVAGGYAYNHTFKDYNYRSILRMKQSVEHNDWQSVLDIARQQKPDVPPTRIQVCYTRLALYKLGLSGNNLFYYPDGDSNYATDIPNQYLRLIAGPQLYYHLGKSNYAYRWCMEDLVEYGLRPQYLSYMLRAALINDEQALADKYARQLNAHPFYHVDTAHAFEAERKEIEPLRQYNNILDGDGGHVEAYLLQSYATMQGGTRQMVTLSLDCTLILKDIADFWPLFVKMLPVWKYENADRIPRHYQEAALLFAYLQGNIDLSGVAIDSDVQKGFEALIAEATANSQYGDDFNARRLRPAYGHTYWYYYFFVNNLKTN